MHRFGNIERKQRGGCRSFAVALMFGMLGSTGCKRSVGGATDGDLVAAPVPIIDPTRPVLARFWLQADPGAGAVSLFRLDAENRIHSVTARTEELRYEYGDGRKATQDTCQPGASCVPAPQSVRLWTDQSKVTYMVPGGGCRSNGGNCGDPTSGGVVHAPVPTTPPCNTPGVFCGPIQMVSRYASSDGSVAALTDVVVQIDNESGTANRVLGCLDTPAPSFGLCKYGGRTKVDDPAHSSLVSAISGVTDGGVAGEPCSYCYGNPARVGSRTGMKHAVLTNLGGSADDLMRDIYTDTIALRLENSATFGVAIDVRYALPGFDTRPIVLTEGGQAVSCATPGITDLTVWGGSFGPPAPCLSATQPPASCPAVGARPAGGYRLRFDGGATAGTYSMWSDTQIAATVPTGVSGSAVHVTVVTPLGEATSTATFAVCSG